MKNKETLQVTEQLAVFGLPDAMVIIIMSNIAVSDWVCKTLQCLLKIKIKCIQICIRLFTVSEQSYIQKKEPMKLISLQFTLNDWVKSKCAGIMQNTLWRIERILTNLHFWLAIAVTHATNMSANGYNNQCSKNMFYIGQNALYLSYCLVLVS